MTLPTTGCLRCYGANVNYWSVNGLLHTHCRECGYRESYPYRAPPDETPADVPIPPDDEEFE